MHLDLIFADVVLRVARGFDEESGAPSAGEIRALVLIPFLESAPRTIVAFRRIDRVFERFVRIFLE
jgi:hypothetical protein